MFKKRLKELRKKYGYTQKELGEKIGVNDNTITNYEKGIREPDNTTLIKIANILEVSTDYLLGKESNPNKVISVKEDKYEYIIEKAKSSGVSPEKLEKLIDLLNSDE